MDEKFTRNTIALLTVVSFLGIMAFLIIYPYINDLKGMTGNDSVMIEYLDKTSSIFTGIIGVILGYYFGSRSYKTQANSD